MRVGDAIGHPLKIHTDLPMQKRKDKILNLMEKVGLTPAEFLYNKYPHQLSGGQSQRVVIARALDYKPRISGGRRAYSHGRRFSQGIDSGIDEKSEAGVRFNISFYHPRSFNRKIPLRQDCNHVSGAVSLKSAILKIFLPLPIIHIQKPCSPRSRYRTRP